MVQWTLDYIGRYEMTETIYIFLLCFCKLFLEHVNSVLDTNQDGSG